MVELRSLAWFFGIATLAVYASMVVHIFTAPGGTKLMDPGTLDTSPGWTIESATGQPGGLLDRLGDDGRKAYLELYLKPPGDLALPLCYAPLFAVLLRMLYPGRPLLVVVAILSGLMDLFENWSVVQMLQAWPDMSAVPEVALLGGPKATIAKWVCLITALVATLVGVVAPAGPGTVKEKQ